MLTCVPGGTDILFHSILTDAKCYCYDRSAAIRLVGRQYYCQTKDSVISGACTVRVISPILQTELEKPFVRRNAQHTDAIYLGAQGRGGVVVMTCSGIPLVVYWID